MPPPAQLWETPDQRFSVSLDNGQGIDGSEEEINNGEPDIAEPNMRVSFSVFKLVVTTTILNIASNAFDASKITLTNKPDDAEVKATQVRI